MKEQDNIFDSSGEILQEGVRSVVKNVPTESEPVEKEKITIDKKKLVIYSEILKQKF